MEENLRHIKVGTLDIKQAVKLIRSISNILLLVLIGLSDSLGQSVQTHPCLMITKTGIADIKANLDSAPLFKSTLEETRIEVDKEILIGVEVPVPKDMSGGYTHERHKQNFFILQKAGYLFQITGDEKYAQYIKDVFLAYAEMFPTLPKHPTDRSYATGKIFWQCLNDANWLVYCSQAYDCIYDWLTTEERSLLETRLFRPLADFLSIENPQFYNRIHNHSTWGNAAVGMIGLVMNDKELVARALYGIQEDGLDPTMIDNDGGYIKQEGVRKAGFLAQLDYSFSPDGHFTEGPYYLRYAMSPFLLFAKSLASTRPVLDIYNYREGILKKAIYSLLYETDAKGRFFPINDSQKGMSWLSREVIAAVDIGYADMGRDPMLLSIAQIQNKVQLDETGFAVAADIAKGLTKPFSHKSISYRDGPEGESGGITILRTSDIRGEEICLLMKYAAQGMGHGHFDRLSFSLYDHDGEVIQDYGAARWVNIDQKGGGRYLKENQSFAKQTVAHNTLVVNQKSQYKGDVKTGEENNPVLYFDDFVNEDLQVVSSKDSSAYNGTLMHRTFFLLNDVAFRKPIVIDLLRVESQADQQYDLPLWFMGHLLSTSFETQSDESHLETLGSGHGYQHLWKEAVGKPSAISDQVTWFGNEKLFTITTAANGDDEFIFARPGANDPNFNLRHDPVFIHRKNAQKNALFASVLESHGRYDRVTEIPLDPFSSIENIEILHDAIEYTVVKLTTVSGGSWTIGLANKDCNKNEKHKLEIAGETIKWKGPYFIDKK